MGKNKAKDIQQRIYDVFNTTICNMSLSQPDQQHLSVDVGPDCWDIKPRTVHGFFHLTNLDFYRSDMSMTWSRSLIGDCFLCRLYDDQIAVTIPPVMMTPTKAWDMRGNGLTLGVYHNYFIDGKPKEKTFGFKRLWEKKGGKEQFPEANGICPIKESS
jgi:hypothetical protein